MLNVCRCRSPMNSQITNAIANALGWKAGDVRSRPVSGGSIAGSWRLENGDDRVFVKTMPSSQASMLEAERDGLERLAAAGVVRTPSVLGLGEVEETAWLA